MKTELKNKIIHELGVFLFYALFLMFFFCSLSTYRRLILEEYTISYLHYGYGVVEALIISKIIVVGKHFRLGERLKDKPLIIPTLYKTFAFSILVLLFTVCEHFISGYLHGKTVSVVYQEILSKGLDEIFSKVLVVFVVFTLLFALEETSRVLGENKLLRLFFSRKEI